VTRSIAKVTVLLALLAAGTVPALAACGGANGTQAAAPAPSVVVLDAPPAASGAAPVASTSALLLADAGPSGDTLDPTIAAPVASGRDFLNPPDASSREARNASSAPAGQHRTFVVRGFERWRGAIESYVSVVKWSYQTPLNTAGVPFARYLNGMHNRIHPIFAETFLDSLDALAPSHPMNDTKLVTRLEIVLTKDGNIDKMGVVRPSGITAFDIAVLESVDRARPFGPVPPAIVSGDGKVYLHWEFHRDEIFACSTMGARPFLLR
jgi:TonB family protein